MAGAGEKGEEKGFKVADRRRFSPEAREPEPTKQEEAVTGKAQGQGPAGEESAAQENAGPDDVPEISFSTFVIGLSTQALMHLGEIPNPLSEKVESALPVAKQMIDIIAILREKTRGNLDQGEQKLMDDVLYDLRMRYVEAVKRR